MIKFLVTAAVVLICVFILVLVLCLMIWVITRLLRFLFPQCFGVKATPKKPKKKVRKIVVDADEDAEET